MVPLLKKVELDFLLLRMINGEESAASEDKIFTFPESLGFSA